MKNSNKPEEAIAECQAETGGENAEFLRLRSLLLEKGVASAEDNDPVRLSEITIDDFLTLSSEDMREAEGYFTPKQIRELWQRRDEIIDICTFQYMTFSAADIFDEEFDYIYEDGNDPDNYPPEELEEIKKLRKVCPFTGLEPDSSIEAFGFDHPWIGEGEIRLNNSIIKELVNLAQRVGADITDVSIFNKEDKVFSCHCSREVLRDVCSSPIGNGRLFVRVEDKLGVLDEQSFVREIMNDVLKNKFKRGEDTEVRFEIETPEGTRTVFASVFQSFRGRVGNVLEEEEPSECEQAEERLLQRHMDEVATALNEADPITKEILSMHLEYNNGQIEPCEIDGTTFYQVHHDQMFEFYAGTKDGKRYLYIFGEIYDDNGDCSVGGEFREVEKWEDFFNL